MSRDGILPPGVEAYMIPSNRPEDEAWDKFIDKFFQHTHFTEAELKFIDEPEVADIVARAIQYGYDGGLRQQQLIDEENKFFGQQERGRQDGYSIR